MAGFVVSASSVGASESGIYVEVRDGSDWVAADGFADRSQGQSGLVSGSDIPLTTAGDAVYRIYAIIPATTDIGDITLDREGETGTPTILIGEAPSPVFSLTTQLNQGCRHLSSLTGAFDRRVQFEIYGDITGTVSASELGRCGAAGTVSGSIIHNFLDAATPPVCGDLYTETVSSTGLVESRGADIPFFDVDVDLAGTLRATGGGDILLVSGDGVITGTIVSTDGFIGSIVLLNTNDIGVQGTLATISAKNGIDLIDCAALYADVTANNGGTGDIDRCITRVGPFEGSLAARTAGTTAEHDWLNIRTDLDAVVTLDQALTQRVFIGRSLTTNGRINLPSGGLQEVIFINTDDLSTAVWDGVINVGSTAITGPNYTYFSSGLGGGDVALVRYGMHGVDCQPKDGSVIGGGGSLGADIYEVAVSHYGYVQFDTEDPSPLLIEWRSTMPWASGEWTDVTSQYQMAMEGTGLSQVVVVSRIDEEPFAQASEYRITPANTGSPAVNILKTDGMGVARIYPVADYEYNLTLHLNRDLNLNGLVDLPDVDVWVADPIDLNDDQTADSQDLVELLEEISSN